MGNKVLLVDADILVYRHSWSNETSIDWGDCTSRNVNPEKAIANLEDQLGFLLSKTESSEYLMCLTGGTNFRKDIFPAYKAHRKNTPKPELYHTIKSYVIENHPTKMYDTLEADDVMGILATLEPEKYLLTSTDKDFKQVPCTIYNWNHGKYYTITEPMADHFFYRQVLTGDPADGYKGIHGIGKVKAKKILAMDGHPWQNVVRAYKEHGMTYEYALTQARVARILRMEDYDFVRKKPILWTPPV